MIIQLLINTGRATDGSPCFCAFSRVSRELRLRARWRVCTFPLASRIIRSRGPLLRLRPGKRSPPETSTNRSGSGRSRKDRGESSDAIVLGAELAAASQAEQRRLARAQPARSPMPDQEYDFESGEMSLVRPVPQPVE